jgi:hypothetical protein
LSGAVRAPHARATIPVEQARSALLPDLDLEVLARHVVPGSSLTAAVRAFRAARALP